MQFENKDGKMTRKRLLWIAVFSILCLGSLSGIYLTYSLDNKDFVLVLSLIFVPSYVGLMANTYFSHRPDGDDDYHPSLS